jgi:hypothetical protein
MRSFLASFLRGTGSVINLGGSIARPPAHRDHGSEQLPADAATNPWDELDDDGVSPAERIAGAVEECPKGIIYLTNQARRFVTPAWAARSGSSSTG